MALVECKNLIKEELGGVGPGLGGLLSLGIS